MSNSHHYEPKNSKYYIFLQIILKIGENIKNKIKIFNFLILFNGLKSYDNPIQKEKHKIIMSFMRYEGFSISPWCCYQKNFKTSFFM